MKTVLTETALPSIERSGTDPKTAWNNAVKLIKQKTDG